MIIKAITLYEPWASWIAMGLKRIETRLHDRFRSLVGQRIAIHAGAKFDRSAYAEASKYLPMRNLLVVEPAHGKIVCTVMVNDFRNLGPADSAAALIDCAHTPRYGLLLGRPERLGCPVLAVGHQGIWNWEPPPDFVFSAASAASAVNPSGGGQP
jgi:hypothetical protein